MGETHTNPIASNDTTGRRDLTGTVQPRGTDQSWYGTAVVDNLIAEAYRRTKINKTGTHTERGTAAYATLIAGTSARQNLTNASGRA